MRSAERVSHGDEPDLTAFPKVPEDNRFTLGYLFASDEWGVRSIAKLSTNEEAFPNGLPTAEEPSDRVLVAADLALGRFRP